MNLPTRHRSLAARIASAGAFVDQSKPAEGAKDETNTDLTITIPEDLSALTDEELAALRDQVIEAFNTLKAEPATADTLATLKSLRDANTILNTEITTRAELAEALKQEIAGLDAEINGAPVDDSLPVDDLDPAAAMPVAAAADTATMAGAVPGAPAPAAPSGGAPAPANAVPAEVVVKAATNIGDGAKMLLDAAGGAPNGAAAQTATFANKKRMPQTINVGNLAARTNGAAAIRQATGQDTSQDGLITAAVNVPGLQPGERLTMDAAAEAMDRALRGASSGAVKAALRAGQHFSQRYPIAQINKRMAAELSAGDSLVPFDTDHPAYKFATDQSRLPGNSLVAAGGWCAPSETVYDLCSLESTDGLISIPEINVTRGGLRFTTGPDWTDIFDSTGFCFTEADDIAGIYGGNEVQSLTEGGAGLTSFTLTFGAQTTVSIPASTTALAIRSALETLSTIGPNNVYVTGPAGASNGPWNVQFVNALGDTNVAQMTSTPTGGSGTLTVATVTQGDSVVSGKPCNSIPCPAFTDVRLNACGVCITGANLQDTAYPELTKRYIQGAMTGHAHRLSTQVIASMITQSTPLTYTSMTNEKAALAPILSSIEFNVEDMRYKRRMARSTIMEAVFPFWVRGVIRADLSRQVTGELDNYSVTDAMINAWFASRGINPQFVYNWQNLGSGTSSQKWPTSLQYLLYPAGTFVKGTQDIITLEMLHDSTLNATNNFTAIFTEEAWSVMKMCLESRVITVSVCPAGVRSLAAAFDCAAGS